MTNYSQRYAAGDSNTAGSFYFDTITAVDYPASKVLWGAEGAVNHCSAANPLPVTAVNGGTFAVQAAQSGTWNITNVSGTISLPTGAATAAKQPALGTAGTASADVITIQGIASMTAVKVDGSAVTQPVSGTVTANQGGTWTVQPGNTANTTAWLVTGTGGTFPVTDSGGSLTVDNNGTFAVQATVAAAATNIAKAEDAASADADVGVPAMAVRKATPANTSGTDGDYEMLQMSAGRLWVDASGVTLTVGSHAVTNAGVFAVQVDGTALTRLTDIETNTDSLAVVGNGAAATAVRVTMANDSTGIVALTTSTASIGKLASNTGVTIGAVEIAAAQTLATVTTVSTVTTCSTLTGSGVAHDAADSGNPHKVGAKATTSLAGVTLVANADRTDLYAGSDGVLINRPHCSLEDIVSGNASNTDGTSTQCIAASGAGVKTYLQSVILTNTSASNIYVEIKDGTTVKLTIPVPANGGAVVNLPVPIGGTANTAWNFDPSAATTTVYCSMVGWKSKV